MAVHKSRKSRSRRDMRRAHYKLENPMLATDQTTGEVHQRHHITPDGYYRGRQVLKSTEIVSEETASKEE